MREAVPLHGVRPYPELTWTAVMLGWLLGIIIAISIGYAALILGCSIEGSWSASADGYAEESSASLDRAAVRFRAALDLLQAAADSKVP